MVGGAARGAGPIARAVVLIVGSRGNFCSGVALARDLVLTAAHCVLPGADYKIVEYDSARQPQLRDVASVTAHPKFDLNNHAGASRDRGRRAAQARRSARIGRARRALHGPGFTVAPGDAFTVAGTGVAVRDDGKSGGTVRAANLIATGRPGTLQIRLHDAATQGR